MARERPFARGVAVKPSHPVMVMWMSSSVVCLLALLVISVETASVLFVTSSAL